MERVRALDSLSQHLPGLFSRGLNGHLPSSPPFHMGIMDLSGGGGGLGCNAVTVETLWLADMSSKDPLLSDTEARGPGDAGPRTFSLQRQDPDRSQASGFPTLHSGIPFHLSTELDPQSMQTPRCTAAEVCVCGDTYRPGSGWRLSSDSRRPRSGRSSRS